jgi:toxin ParE1/3/4
MISCKFTCRSGSNNRPPPSGYFDRIEAKSQLLKSQPRMGGRRSDIRPSMRMLIEAPYVLLYRTDPDTEEGPIGTVEIIRIVDGRRDLGGIF